jgi:hypothetical protein
MKSWVAVILLILFSLPILAQTQSFELIDRQEAYQVPMGESLRIPVKIKNNTSKSQFYIIRKVHDDLGGSQKGYFCLDKNCLEPGIEEFSKRVEPGETLYNLVFVMESGIQPGINTIKFQVFARGNPTDVVEYAVNVTVQEKTNKPVIFHSKDITVEDVYPNPVQDIAYIHYRIHNESVSAKVIIHNILGKPLNEIELSPLEDRAKLQTEEFVSGIYFYTVYLDNNGVLTRKLIIRK